jgi:hypothetical protein
MDHFYKEAYCVWFVGCTAHYHKLNFFQKSFNFTTIDGSVD